MNKEEICFKLIEFYYLNKSLINHNKMNLFDLFEEYNKMLKVLKVESDEKK